MNASFFVHPSGKEVFIFAICGGRVRLSLTDDALTHFGGLVPSAAFQNTELFERLPSPVWRHRGCSGGTVVDTTNLAISKAANTQIYPTVASNGTNYLVVYQSNASATNRVRGNLITP